MALSKQILYYLFELRARHWHHCFSTQISRVMSPI